MKWSISDLWIMKILKQLFQTLVIIYCYWYHFFKCYTCVCCAAELTTGCVLQTVMQGTIPYLGTFLTDLVMMDTAMKDYLDVSLSLINRGGSLHTGSSGVKLIEKIKLLRNTPPTERVSEYYNCAPVVQEFLHSLKAARPHKE